MEEKRVQKDREEGENKKIIFSKQLKIIIWTKLEKLYTLEDLKRRF